ncbi:MAG: hypothetical protein PHG75_05655 [Syntrophomonas sp.]|nr:hypothetical protein [Syntrophomonas sp.]
MEPVTTAAPYNQILEDLLARLHSDLDHQAQHFPAGVESEGLDQYLLDLNTFYYQSFHDHFMPKYQQAMESDLRRIHGLSRQDTTVQANLVATLRLLTRLYNQTKTSISQLQGLHNQTDAHLLVVQTGVEARSVDLLYLLKEHTEAWVEFRHQVDISRTLVMDRPLCSTLARFPSVSLAAGLFRTWKPANGRDKREFNRLLAQWQLALRLLMQMQGTPSPGKAYFNPQLDELEKIDASWDQRKAIPAVRGWYKLNLQPTYHLYLEVLKDSAARNDQRRTSRTAVQFYDWLQAWLRILEYSLDFSARGWDGWLDRLSSLANLEEDHGLVWADFSQRGLQSIDELITGLSTARDDSYRPFRDKARQILTEARQQLHLSGEEQPGTIGPLRPAAERLAGEIDMTLRAMEIIDDREAHIQAEMVTYTSINAILASEIAILATVHQEVAKMLDNRLLKNNFENLEIQVEHVAIQTGAQFPAAYAYLLDQFPIEVQAGDAPPGTVIHDEGDLFIIQVGEQSYHEIPRIIISGKG